MTAANLSGEQALTETGPIHIPMAHLRNGKKEDSRHLNGGGINESRCQLADPRRVNGDNCGTNNNIDIVRNDDAGQTSEPLYVNHLLNGSATESELLQHISENISNLSLNPRPTADSSATTRLPSVAPKPSKQSKKNQHQNRSKSSRQMGYQFYVNESKPNKAGHHRSAAGAQGDAEDENRTLRFVGQRGLATGDGDDITSSKGTVRGVTNRVRAGITNFTYKPLNHAKVSKPIRQVIQALALF